MDYSSPRLFSLQGYAKALIDKLDGSIRLVRLNSRSFQLLTCLPAEVEEPEGPQA